MIAPLAAAAAAARRVAGDVGELLFPLRCPACGGPPGAPPEAHLCRECRAVLAHPAPPVCAGCGVAAAPASGEAFCPGCRGRWARDAVVVAAPYAGPARDLVRALKYRADFAAGNAAAFLLAASVRRSGFAADLVVPVPLHRGRLRERGFNQAAFLGRALARALGAPFAADALRRTRPTRALAGLERGEREREVAEVFAARRAGAAAGARVLLVDDVLTTGATAEGCSAALKGAGATWVGVAVAARAYPALGRVAAPGRD